MLPNDAARRPALITIMMTLVMRTRSQWAAFAASPFQLCQHRRRPDDLWPAFSARARRNGGRDAETAKVKGPATSGAV